MKKALASGLLVLATTSGFLVATQSTAEAVGGNCSSNRQEDEVFGPNNYRVRASCSTLQGDSKARGILNRTGADATTSWFTTKNKYYYSEWTACLYGCATTSTEVTHV